jgi:hypothetical protein
VRGMGRHLSMEGGPFCPGISSSVCNIGDVGSDVGGIGGVGSDMGGLRNVGQDAGSDVEGARDVDSGLGDVSDAATSGH